VSFVAASPASSVTKAELRSKLLSLSDLPAGWTVHNSSGTSSNVTSGCLLGVKHAPKNETKAAATFEDGQAFFDEGIVGGRDAATAYNRLNLVLTRCTHFTATSDGLTFRATVGRTSFPAVGDESSAFEVTLTSEGLSVRADFVLFRLKGLATLIEYANLGQSDRTQLQDFVTEAVDKIEGKPITRTV
jgi:hypothetical protein